MSFVVGGKVLLDNVHVCTITKIGSAGSTTAIVVRRDFDGKQFAFFGQSVSLHVQAL